MNQSNPSSVGPEVLISADSHVMEPPDLLATRVPGALRNTVPRFPAHQVGVGFQHHPGAQDPNARIKEMEVDGISAEVLYPTLCLDLFGLDDAAMQEACFRVYNDWLIEYCQAVPDRLVGIAAIPAYNIDRGVEELTRCRKAGLKGAMIWQTPHPDLPFHSRHYEPFWAAAQDLDAPLSLHILSGHGYHKHPELRKGVEHTRGSVNLKLMNVTDALFEFIFYGILERFPGLKLVTVENEIGWLPFMLQQWDYYLQRKYGGPGNPIPIKLSPSEYFKRQIFATFFNDTVGGHNLEWWGEENCMWSNDFPHPNSTWPDSRKVIKRDLGHLPAEKRVKILSANAGKLYGLKSLAA